MMEVVLPFAVEILDTVVLLKHIRPANIPSSARAFTLSHPGLQRLCANDEAPANMEFALTSADTSHLDMSQLNNLAP